MAFAAYALHIKLPVIDYIALGISVWLIYIADHLWDSARLTPSASSKYLFYKQNFKILLILFFLLSGFDAFLIFNFLPVKAYLWGVVIGSLVAGYFGLHYSLKNNLRRFFPKELLIAVFYILGIWFLPFQKSLLFDTEAFFSITIHFLIVLSNVSLFSLYERDEDRSNIQISLFSGLKEPRHRGIVTGVCVLSVLSVIIGLCLGSDKYTYLILILIGSIFLGLAIMHSCGKKEHFFPELTDGALLLFLAFCF